MITGIDHLVLTVASIDATCAFYKRALAIEAEHYAPGRVALRLGGQKINLHGRTGRPDLVARAPTEGGADFCLLSDRPIREIEAHLKGLRIDIIAGPVERSGARGPILSIYFHDPDGNLVEVANPLGPQSKA